MKGKIAIDKERMVKVLIFSVAGALAVALGVFAWTNVNVSLRKSYSAVYLETGEVYFGQLSYFPKLTLRNVYTVRTAVDPSDPTQATFQVVPLGLSVWQGNTLRLNRDKIVFIGKVGENSQVMQAIHNQETLDNL